MTASIKKYKNDIPLKDRGLLQLYLDTLRSYAVFRGRSPRAQYWGFMIFYFLFLGLMLLIVLMAVFLCFPGNKAVLPLVPDLYSLAFFLPMVALIVRRLHDIGGSGWLVLIYPACWITAVVAKSMEDIHSPVHAAALLLKLAAFILFVASGFSPGSKGSNKFGPNPYGIEKTDAP